MTAIGFVPLRLDHLPLMHGWFAQPHMQYWTRGHAYSLAEIEAKYGGRARGEDLSVSAFIIEHEGTPGGYIQYYPVATSVPEGVVDPATSPLFAAHDRSTMAGIDVFLGDPALLGRGLGTSAIQAFLVREVLPHYAVVVVDPMASNDRAIRAFERSGFRRTDYSQDDDHEILVMP